MFHQLFRRQLVATVPTLMKHTVSIKLWEHIFQSQWNFDIWFLCYFQWNMEYKCLQIHSRPLPCYARLHTTWRCHMGVACPSRKYCQSQLSGGTFIEKAGKELFLYSTFDVQRLTRNHESLEKTFNTLRGASPLVTLWVKLKEVSMKWCLTVVTLGQTLGG